MEGFGIIGERALNKLWDTIIVGAGAAGLYCGIVAGRRGRRVLIIDHSAKIAEKIRISGGGRCNFTNRDLDPKQAQKHFISNNPDFCRSALARFTPQHFIDELDRYGLTYQEKHKGQLFCDQGSSAIIDMLLDEAQAAGVTLEYPVTVNAVEAGDRFRLETSQGTLQSHALVIATGGLSIPQIGASDWGHRIARQFGHAIIEPRPGLVPLKFSQESWQPFSDLSGIAVPARVTLHDTKNSIYFDDDLLLTHRGLSGPAILQISSYWHPKTSLSIDLSPDLSLESRLIEAKNDTEKSLRTVLQRSLPQRLVKTWLKQGDFDEAAVLQSLKDSSLQQLAQSLHRWVITPSGTEGFKKAEVTCGGVDTRGLSSKTMESSHQPGLYFVGEVLDVTGWLGGYNFQWAWASAHAAGSVL